MSRLKLQTVTHDAWSVSVESSSEKTGATLHVHKRSSGFEGSFAYGDANGKRFKTSNDAWAYALEHGYVVPYFRRARLERWVSAKDLAQEAKRQASRIVKARERSRLWSTC